MAVLTRPLAEGEKAEADPARRVASAITLTIFSILRYSIWKEGDVACSVASCSCWAQGRGTTVLVELFFSVRTSFLAWGCCCCCCCYCFALVVVRVRQLYASLRKDRGLALFNNQKENRNLNLSWTTSPRDIDRDFKIPTLLGYTLTPHKPFSQNQNQNKKMKNAVYQ